MRIKHLFVFLLFLLPCAVYAQNAVPPTFTVKGVLLDSLTNESEPFATIRIATKAAPTKPVKMAVTDTKGKFQEKITTVPGQYVITITSIGKVPAIKEFVLETGKSVVDLGTLYTAEATNELKGVEVVALKPLVKVDVDKIEYNIEDDPDSKSNSILEMLRKVPLVTVDGEDKIQVNGSSSFKIHVNGKPNSMMSNNPTEVLKSMPANTIKYIEVITSPGAKYDAEGIGGILNIVTVGSGFEGYTATFSGRASTRGFGGGVYATIKKDKLTLTGNYNYSLNSSPKSYQYNETEYHDSKDQKYLLSNSTQKNKGAFQHGNIEASYEIDTLRLITLSAGLYGGGNDSDYWGPTAMYDETRTVKSYGYDANSTGDNSWYSVRGNLDYQRTSKRNKQRMLTFSYKIDTRPQDSDNYTTYKYEGDVPAYLLRPSTHTDGSTNTTEQTFQVDYTTPIGKIHTIETGVKYIIRNNVSENDYLEKPEGTDAYVIDKDRTMHYKHLNDIMAAYVGYTLRYKKYSFKPGVRYEHTAQDVKYVLGNGKDFKSDFNDIVPSVSLGYKLGPTKNLTASYNMRIWRPGIWYLNPYFDDRNPMYISQGNSKLDSEKGHRFNMGFSNFTAKFNVSLTLSHSFNNNSIEQVSKLYKVASETPYKDGNIIPAGAIYSTYANIGKNKDTGLRAYVDWRPTSKIRAYVNASGSYTDIKSPDQGLHNFGWNGSIYGGFQQTLPWDLRLSVNGGGSTPYIELQGKGSGYYYYSLGLNRSFLKEKRLTLSISGSNMFTKYVNYNNTTEGANFTRRNEYKYPSRYYGINISYRIGKLQASVKKAARTISNDDVKGGGGGEGGGGGGN